MSTSLASFTKKLLQNELTTSEFKDALRLIFEEKSDDIQIASFLTALTFSKLDKDAEFIANAASTILEYSKIPDLSKSEHYKNKTFVDIVGTGGDGQNTFNVSTSSAIVVSGIDTSKTVIVKHGGKASTSKSGAGDLMGHLGIATNRINSGTVHNLIEKDENSFLFLFAPSFHSGMKTVANVRAKLGIPTIFNILGPLINPVKVHSRVLGVYAEELGEIYANSIKNLYPEFILENARKNKYSTLVVWGEVGLDEVSPIGKTKIWYFNPEGEVVSEYISPEDFGLPEHSLDTVRSGTPAENAVLLKKILQNEVPETDPVYHYILLNSSVLAVSAGLAGDWKEGVELARKSIKSGNALKSLTKLVESLEA